MLSSYSAGYHAQFVLSRISCSVRTQQDDAMLTLYTLCRRLRTCIGFPCQKSASRAVKKQIARLCIYLAAAGGAV